jgi:hypothetical protein
MVALVVNLWTAARPVPAKHPVVVVAFRWATCMPHFYRFMLWRRRLAPFVPVLAWLAIHGRVLTIRFTTGVALFFRFTDKFLVTDKRSTMRPASSFTTSRSSMLKDG